MAGLSEQVKAMMQKRSQEVKDRQAAGSFTKNWSLTGKNTIVEPGGEVVVRFGPRWDIATVVNGKLTPNPKYVSGAEPIFAVAYEHWWDADGGKTMHEWCPKTLTEDAECPICLAAGYLKKSADEDERKEGKRIEAKEVFIFNTVVGNPRKLADGKADFRIMSVTGTVFTQVCDIMTGGAEASFAYGNIGDHAEGYDLKLTRPRAGGNDRWKVTVAPQSSRLYSDSQAAAFKDWAGMLVNIEEMLTKETKTPLELFKTYYGRDPEGDEMSAAMAAPAEVAAEAEAQVEAQPEAEVVTEPITDEFLPPASQKPAGQRPAPPVPSRAPARGGRR